MVEADKDQGLLGKFLREQNQSQIKDYMVQRKYFENRKKIRCEKTPLKLGTNFWGVTILHSVSVTGASTPAGCSTYVLTSPLKRFYCGYLHGRHRSVEQHLISVL